MTSPYDQAIADMEATPISVKGVHWQHAMATLKGEREGYHRAQRELLPRIPENDLTDEELAFLEEGK